eukprot:6177722-Pleurochrysis_carterae.AAC.1
MRASAVAADDDTVNFKQSLRRRHEGQSAQFARLMLGRKVLLSKRKKAVEKSVAVGKHAFLEQEEKQELRDKVSTELMMEAANLA